MGSSELAIPSAVQLVDSFDRSIPPAEVEIVRDAFVLRIVYVMVDSQTRESTMDPANGHLSSTILEHQPDETFGSFFIHPDGEK
jgi:hypothetical protein